MSPRDRALWLRFQRRASSLSPEMSRALLDAWDIIREGLTPEEIDRLLAGDTSLLDRAFALARSRLTQTVERGFNQAIPILPKAGKIDGVVAMQFDHLNPQVIEAIRELRSRVLNTLSDDVRETVRAYVENGLRDGKNPNAIAKDLRPIIGMSPTQAANAIKYGEKLAAAGKTEAQVERAVATYQRKAIATNAATNARTATVDSLKLGQHLTWQDAADKGIVDLALLDKTWVTVGDDRVRDEHRAMQGETVAFENTFSNGEEIPGESTFNCRCVLSYRQRKAA
jgi:hypothetical protein